MEGVLELRTRRRRLELAAMKERCNLAQLKERCAALKRELNELSLAAEASLAEASAFDKQITDSDAGSGNQRSLAAVYAYAAYCGSLKDAAARAALELNQRAEPAGHALASAAAQAQRSSSRESLLISASESAGKSVAARGRALESVKNAELYALAKGAANG